MSNGMKFSVHNVCMWFKCKSGDGSRVRLEGECERVMDVFWSDMNCVVMCVADCVGGFE